MCGLGTCVDTLTVTIGLKVSAIASEYEDEGPSYSLKLDPPVLANADPQSRGRLEDERRKSEDLEKSLEALQAEKSELESKLEEASKAPEAVEDVNPSQPDNHDEQRGRAEQLIV